MPERNTKTETIKDGEVKYTVVYEPVIECEHCDYNWTTRSEARRPTCPSCQRKTDRTVVGGYYEDITRHNLLSFELVDGDHVVSELRNRANKYEAMLDNGWRLLGTGNQSSVWLVKGDVDLTAPVE